MPLPLIEGAYFLASVVGVLLLLVARGLQQRLDIAYVLASGLLGLGMVFSLLKGLDYEEALLLLAILLALLPAHHHFYRRASLVRERFSPGWILAMLAAVAGSVVIGMFAFRRVPYSMDLWSRFTLLGHAPRFLRASFGAATVATLSAGAWLMRPAPRRPARASADDLAAVQRIVSSELDPRGALALVGDKSLLFDAERSAFLMYAVQGRSWVALGDPVGPRSRWDELCWRFREMVDREAGRVAFYDVGAASLPRYVDMGLTLLKLGDEARVPLTDFSLEGPERKTLRQAFVRAERDGASFAVLEPDQAARRDGRAAGRVGPLARAEEDAREGILAGLLRPRVHRTLSRGRRPAGWPHRGVREHLARAPGGSCRRPDALRDRRARGRDGLPVRELMLWGHAQG